MTRTGNKGLRQRRLGKRRNLFVQRAARYFGLPAQLFVDLLRYGYTPPAQEK